MEPDIGSEIPQWRVAGDCFDVCKCNIPCPCYFAQPPTYGDCEGVLAWHVREGTYGDVRLDGLNLLAAGAFEGNIWAEETKATMWPSSSTSVSTIASARRCKWSSAAAKRSADREIRRTDWGGPWGRVRSH